ncbi:hypothetical protein GF367_02305 [Candidatus Woesearchaeota archaeon]|nr:hypothetical protein [Candidatus Woesearchaeota archaeon]
MVFRYAIIIELLLMGMRLSPKWGRARIPGMFMNRFFGRYVLRGYFDIDGSVVIANNNGPRYPRLEMKNKPFSYARPAIDALRLAWVPLWSLRYWERESACADERALCLEEMG